MPTLAAFPCRLRFDVPAFALAHEVRTNARAVFPRGNDVRIEVGIFHASAPLDISNLASLRLEIRAGRTEGATLLAVDELENADLTALTGPAWEAATGQHAVFTFTAAETNQSLGGLAEKEFYLVLAGLTSGGKAITYGLAAIRIVEDVTGTTDTPPPVPPEDYYTQSEIDALLAMLAPLSHTHTRADISDASAFGRLRMGDADAPTAFAALKQAATEAATGVVELATEAEARAGTDTTRAPHVLALKSALDLYAGGRALPDHLQFDGATASRRAYWTMGTAGAVAGKPLTFRAQFRVPEANPSAIQYIFFSGPSSTGISGATLAFAITTAGALALYQYGANPANSDSRSLLYAAFRATYSGRWVKIAISFASPDTTTAPVITINGVDASGSFALATAGTVPPWLDSATWIPTYFTAGWAFTTELIPHGPILGALTVAEMLAWVQTGLLPSWCEVGTGNAVLIIGPSTLNGGFETAGGGGADVFALWAESVAGTSTVNDETVNMYAGAHACRIDVDSSGSFAGISGGLTLKAGWKYRLKFRARNSGGTAGIQVGNEIAGTAYGIITTLTASYALQTIEFVATGSNFILARAAGISTSQSIYIDDVELIELGPIFKPVVQPIRVLADRGANKIAGILTAGVTPITPRRDWVIQGKTNTSGNQQLLGASVFETGNNQMLDTLETNGAATPTVSIGSASGGAQYKASAAILSGRNRHALVTPIVASANLWVASSTADELTHTIRGHLID